ncbi:HAD-IB family hydrolase [Candidatus Parcubacteria bacterium]|nr:MAG: HAD-IB family hydrolase [Candidatus Parcubacteria bacterium]
MKNIVFFDLDNTIVRGYTQKLFISYLFEIRKINIIFLFYVYFWFALYKYRIVKNPKRTMERAYSFINGWSVTHVEDLLDDFYRTKIVDLLNIEVVTRIKNHINSDCSVYIISNAPNKIVEKIGNELGINKNISTTLGESRGRFTGQIVGDIVYGENKSKLVLNLLSKEEGLFKTVFYSDHYSDIPLFEIVDTKIAVSPDKILRKKALDNKWEIIE